MAYLYLGPIDAAFDVSEAEVTWEGANNDLLGYSVAFVDAQDGSGLGADALVGSPGTYNGGAIGVAYLFSGSY